MSATANPADSPSLRYRLPMQPPRVIIIMGVSGSGKSTVGAALAKALRWAFHDADDDHPPANIDRMRRGQPLTDEHRQVWLDVLSQRIQQWLEANEPTVLACSALTRKARRRLHGDDRRVRFVFLRGEPEVIRSRMANREHFMPSTLLQDQYDTLQEPDPDERALTLDARESPQSLVREICRQLMPGDD